MYRDNDLREPELPEPDGEPTDSMRLLIDEYSARLQRLHATAKDPLVTIEVSCDGTLTGVTITRNALRTNPADLEQAILNRYGEASTAAKKASNDILAEMRADPRLEELTPEAAQPSSPTEASWETVSESYWRPKTWLR